MLPDPNDTIVALSSPRGPGARAIVRLSGSGAWAVAADLFALRTAAKPPGRMLQSGTMHLPGLASELTGDFYFWPAPRTYTGQDVAEIHTLSCPPLIELLVARCLDAGACAAQAGEFTMRAFLAGKLDLPKAEAILGVIEAGDRDDLKQALAQLAGGVGQPLHQIRDDLLSLLADIEAGLDFTEEGIQFIQQKELLDRLTRSMARVTLDSPATGATGDGAASLSRRACRSAQCAAKAACSMRWSARTPPLSTPDRARPAIIWRRRSTPAERKSCSSIPPAFERPVIHWNRQRKLWGKTRRRMRIWFSCARKRAARGKGKANQEMARPDGTGGHQMRSRGSGGRLLGHERPDRNRYRESARRIIAPALSRKQSPLAPSLSRCRHHVEACLGHLRQAHGIVLNDDPTELLAVEVRGALDELGASSGRCTRMTCWIGFLVGFVLGSKQVCRTDQRHGISPLGLV